jgi:hypothetical protein
VHQLLVEALPISVVVAKKLKEKPEVVEVGKADEGLAEVVSRPATI